jgi:crotonobetainyl-CoA:carnitine CoA-transferase CaiB-like acyl-CoA transferase
MAAALPLDGIVVLEVTANLAGPYCGMLLADMGANVIKVERPTGDQTRRIPPYFVEGNSVYFASVNRNKRIIAIDGARTEGIALLHDLTSKADVFLTNMRPRAVDKMLLDYDTVRGLNENIVYCHITGFGKSTSSANRPAYDLIVQAMGGNMSMTGDQEGGPCRSGFPIGDLNAGVFSALGILSALLRRQVTGRGAQLDVSLLGAQLAYASYLAANQAVGGRPPGRSGAGQQSSAPYNRYLCADGKWIVIAAPYDNFFAKLAAVIGQPQLATDARFATRALRVENRVALDELLAARIGTGIRDYWVRILSQADVPCAPVNDLSEAIGSAEAAEAELVTWLEYPSGVSLPLTGSPVNFVGDQKVPPRAAPAFSQDYAWVLGTVLGCGPDRIGQLIDDQVVLAG